MDLNYKKIQNTVVVYLKGKLDVQQVDDIEKDMKRLLNAETSCHFLLNLQGIDYVSSSGIGFLVFMMNSMKERGKIFGICELSSSVRRIMDIVEMNVLFHIFNDEPEAFEFLNSK